MSCICVYFKCNCVCFFCLYYSFNNTGYYNLLLWHHQECLKRNIFDDFGDFNAEKKTFLLKIIFEWTFFYFNSYLKECSRSGDFWPYCKL